MRPYVPLLLTQVFQFYPYRTFLLEFNDIVYAMSDDHFYDLIFITYECSCDRRTGLNRQYLITIIIYTDWAML